MKDDRKQLWIYFSKFVTERLFTWHIHSQSILKKYIKNVSCLFEYESFQVTKVHFLQKLLYSAPSVLSWLTLIHNSYQNLLRIKFFKAHGRRCPWPFAVQKCIGSCSKFILRKLRHAFLVFFFIDALLISFIHMSWW